MSRRKGQGHQDLVFYQCAYVEFFFNQYAFEFFVGKHGFVQGLFVGKQDDTAAFIKHERHGFDTSLADQGHIGFDVQVEKQALQPVATAGQCKRYFGLPVGGIIVQTDSLVQFFQQKTALQVLPFGGKNFRVNQIRV